MINRELAEKRGLDEKTISRIEEIHKDLHTFTLLDPLDLTPNEKKLLKDVIKSKEFELQTLWGFDVNEDFHRHWSSLKGCLCPKTDNMSFIGAPMRYINGTCPWHGNEGE